MEGFLAKNKDELSPDLLSLLLDSSNQHVVGLFVEADDAGDELTTPPHTLSHPHTLTSMWNE